MVLLGYVTVTLRESLLELGAECGHLGVIDFRIVYGINYVNGGL